MCVCVCNVSDGVGISLSFSTQDTRDAFRFARLKLLTHNTVFKIWGKPKKCRLFVRYSLGSHTNTLMSICISWYVLLLYYSIWGWLIHIKFTRNYLWRSYHARGNTYCIHTQLLWLFFFIKNRGIVIKNTNNHTKGVKMMWRIKPFN